MLTLRIINDGFGDNESASYEYFVFINGREITRGTIGGHDRNDGWQGLVRMIADAHVRDDEEIEFHGEGIA